MGVKLNILLLLTLELLRSQVHSFSVVSVGSNHPPSISKQLTRKSAGFPAFAASPNPVDELSEERRANLFQFLLRDLEVEGVPLLGCDADQAHTTQGTIWTVMAQLSESDVGSKACMVLENMPVESLREIVDDFATLKADETLMGPLFELKRFNVTLVGRGVGPAILVETGNRTDAEVSKYNSFISSSPPPNELSWTAAMKTFVARMQLEKGGIVPSPVAYRLSASNDVCDILATFWTCVCELIAQSEEDLRSTVLCLPSVLEDSESSEELERFSAISDVVTRSLFMARGQDRFGVSYMHPLYDRNSMDPKDESAFGHLPPTSSVSTLLHEAGREADAAKMSSEQFELQNYLRRSPLPAISIRREPTDETSIKKAYCEAVLRVAEEGGDSLQAALGGEIDLTK